MTAQLTDAAEQVLQLCHDTLFIDVVDNALQLIEHVKRGICRTNACHLLTETDIQIRVAQLRHTRKHYTRANICRTAGMIQTTTVSNKAVLIQLLTGVSRRIDIGNVLSGYIERHLASNHTETRYCKFTKSRHIGGTSSLIMRGNPCALR